MMNEPMRLVRNYPWYYRHTDAVNTIASYLGVDVEKVLYALDSKLRAKVRLGIKRRYLLQAA